MKSLFIFATREISYFGAIKAYLMFALALLSVCWLLLPAIGIRSTFHVMFLLGHFAEANVPRRYLHRLLVKHTLRCGRTCDASKIVVDTVRRHSPSFAAIISI